VLLFLLMAESSVSMSLIKWECKTESLFMRLWNNRLFLLLKLVLPLFLTLELLSLLLLIHFLVNTMIWDKSQIRLICKPLFFLDSIVSLLSEISETKSTIKRWLNILLMSIKEIYKWIWKTLIFLFLWWKNTSLLLNLNVPQDLLSNQQICSMIYT